MDLPVAVVCHQTANRLRLRIPSRRADTAYFGDLVSQLTRLQQFEKLEANSLTGSVLFVDQNIDYQSIAEYALSNLLFQLNDEKTPQAFTHGFLNPLENLSTSIKGMTGGRANLASLIFFVLVAFGVYDLFKGDFKIPPWYTAFWYAFGIFTISLLRETDTVK